MADLYNETITIMKKFGISANKNLGQNFLIDNEAVEKIIESSNITKDDLIIEIGPGLGVLTKHLIEKAGKVIAIELDSRMVSFIEERFKFTKNLEIVNDDILRVDLEKLIKENKLTGDVKIVANLPYYITTPIVMKLLEMELDIKSITIMIQKEVAERFLVRPGEKHCGAITVGIHFYSKPIEIMQVSKNSFIPIPEVDSTVIRLDVLEEPPIKIIDKKVLFDIVKVAFGQRRKTLNNCLINSNIFKSKIEVEDMLKKLDIDGNRRGETLVLEEFEKLTNYILKNN